MMQEFQKKILSSALVLLLFSLDGSPNLTKTREKAIRAVAVT